MSTTVNREMGSKPVSPQPARTEAPGTSRAANTVVSSAQPQPQEPVTGFSDAVPKRAPVLREGSRGPEVTALQNQLNKLGYNAGPPSGVFDSATRVALADIQSANKLNPDGVVSPATQRALNDPGAVKAPDKGGAVLGDGLKIDTSNPILQKLATSPLKDGATGHCVATTTSNMRRQGVPNTPIATGNDPNNPRGAMVQMLQNGGWESVPLPGSRQQTIKSNYGTATANVVSADQYRQLVSQGVIPDGAIIFQTRHGWDWNAGSNGNDMGIVRDHGQTTHNYKSMPGIVYSDCKDVVILVPKGALVQAQ